MRIVPVAYDVKSFKKKKRNRLYYVLWAFALIFIGSLYIFYRNEIIWIPESIFYFSEAGYVLDAFVIILFLLPLIPSYEKNVQLDNQDFTIIR